MRLLTTFLCSLGLAFALGLFAGCPSVPSNGEEKTTGPEENGTHGESEEHGIEAPDANGDRDPNGRDADGGERDSEEILDPNEVHPEDEARTEPPEVLDVVLDEIEVGAPAPSFSLPRIDELETNVSLQDFEGRWTLIKFWFSWCTNCQELAVELIDPLYRDLAAEEDSALKIVSIGLESRDSAASQHAVAEELNLEWLKLFDRPRSEPDSAASLFGTIAVPSAVLLDPDGTVVTFGSLEREEWTNHLRAFLDYKLASDDAQ